MNELLKVFGLQLVIDQVCIKLASFPIINQWVATPAATIWEYETFFGKQYRSYLQSQQQLFAPTAYASNSSFSTGYSTNYSASGLGGLVVAYPGQYIPITQYSHSQLGQYQAGLQQQGITNQYHQNQYALAQQLAQSNPYHNKVFIPAGSSVPAIKAKSKWETFKNFFKLYMPI